MVLAASAWDLYLGRREGQASVMGRVCGRSLELHNFGLGIDICFFGVCVHARVYSWLHVCGYMFLCVPVCGGQRLTSGILLPYCLHHILRQSLSLEPRLAIQLREPHLCPPHVIIPPGHPSTQYSHMYGALPGWAAFTCQAISTTLEIDFLVKYNNLV